MAHGRVAIYTTQGDPGEILHQICAGLAPIMQRQMGFRSYQGFFAGDRIITYSTWDTQEQAEAATQVAMSWSQEKFPGLLMLYALYYGEHHDFTGG